MTFCKKCGLKLIENNIFADDKRFCSTCGLENREFIKGRKISLIGLQSLPLEAKIIKTKQMVTDAINEFGIEHVYISYSGGKDSTVLSHIIKQKYPDIIHLFANTTNEFPETIQHIQWEQNRNLTNIIIATPRDKYGKPWTFNRVVSEYGFPLFSKRISNAIRTYRRAITPITKQNSIDYIQRNFGKYDCYKECNISDLCCEKLKKTPLRQKAKELNLECSIIGTLASESRQRELDWLKNGCNVFHIRKDNQCRPLSFWTQKDIDEYIQKYNVKISKLYEMGYSRNGCMFCGFGITFESSPNRYEILKDTHPAAYQYLERHFGEFLKSCNIKL